MKMRTGHVLNSMLFIGFKLNKIKDPLIFKGLPVFISVTLLSFSLTEIESRTGYISCPTRKEKEMNIY